jgi:glycerol-3-phosphate dehydrogenase
MGTDMDAEIAVVGAGVVGCATALALARRGVAVAVLEAEPEPGLQASGTSSGILHTGFDSPPGELETELILLSARLRDAVLDALRVPVLRCGAVMRGQVTVALIEGARRNGVGVVSHGGGVLEIPGEAVTDPVAYTLALAGAARAAA